MNVQLVASQTEMVIASAGKVFIKTPVLVVSIHGLENVTRVVVDVFLATPLFISSLGN